MPTDDATSGTGPGSRPPPTCAPSPPTSWTPTRPGPGPRAPPERPDRRGPTRIRADPRRRGPPAPGRHQPRQQGHHPPPGTPIRIGVGTAGDHAVLEVADEGAGLPPERSGRIVERVYRADTSRTRATGGSGPVLVLVHSLGSTASTPRRFRRSRRFGRDQ
ncbi:ATP-binding protein [Streptomyces spongiae]|uniref:ATP-binding protein n=1 Tax=Streptomyces spongiae TaxID=565072 RepID=UPI00389A3DF8